MEIIKSVTSFAKRGTSKVQNFVKNHQGVVRTAMMMLLFVSVTSVMAQTPAGLLVPKPSQPLLQT